MTDEIVITDDFELKDSDLLPDEEVEEDVMQVDENAPSKTDTPVQEVRENAVYLQGVDDLSTKDVQVYIKQYLPNEDFRIEWINDTAVNVVFPEVNVADRALTALTSEAVYYDGDTYTATQLRDAKTHPDKPSAKLQVRYAVLNDRKERGARSKSRYYLLHGEPTFEDERYRLTHGNKAAEEADSQEKNILGQYNYQAANTGDELFPQKLKERNGDFSSGVKELRVPKSFGDRVRKGIRATGGDDDQDLFPSKVIKPTVGMSKLDSYRSREGSKSRDRSRSPGRRNDLGRRLNNDGGERWAKGSALADRIGKSSKNRRKAADMF